MHSRSFSRLSRSSFDSFRFSSSNCIRPMSIASGSTDDAFAGGAAVTDAVLRGGRFQGLAQINFDLGLY